MGEFITILFGASAPSPAAVEYDKSMIVGDGSAQLASSKLYAVTNTDWQTQLEDDGFSDSEQIYKSVADFFSASPTPENLFVYAYVAASDADYSDMLLTKIDDTTWEIPSKPPEGWGPGATGLERVRFYGCPKGTGFQWNYQNGSTGMGFTVLKDSQSLWNGQLTFPNGLSGQSGAVVTESNLGTNCKITVDFTIDPDKGGVGEKIADYDISMVSLALENSTALKNYSTNVFGTSQVNDLDTMMSAIAGKMCIFFYAMPGDANPEDLITGGGGVKWGSLKSIVGQREDFVNLKSKPSVTQDDMASGFMGMSSATHPHDTMGFARPHMAIVEQEPMLNQGKWKDANTNYIVQKRFLAGSPFMIVRGFTFGTDANSDRINIVRCKYIILQTLRNGLWSLLAGRKTRMSYKGIVQVEEQIKGIFAGLVKDDIVDSFAYVRIPLKYDFLAKNAASKLAAAKSEISGIRIGYYFDRSLEEIVVTALINEAI